MYRKSMGMKAKKNIALQLATGKIKNMRKIYTIGEAVYDIIFKNGVPIDAKVGGAMINTAVSLGRLNMPVYYVGDAAEDAIGDIMSDFLVKNKVDITYFTKYADSRSRLALAFIDDVNAPKYLFYKIAPPKKLVLDFPEPEADDIVLFGSFNGIKHEVRGQLVDFLIKAKRNGAIILYDPNFRINHKSLLSTVLPFIEDNIRFSDIFKASTEDLEIMFGTQGITETMDRLEHLQIKNMICTQNAQGVDYYSMGQQGHLSIESVEPLSAVGAGDSFNAGLIYYLFTRKISKVDLRNLSMEQWNEMLQIAHSFSLNVCMSTENYISGELVNQYRL